MIRQRCKASGGLGTELAEALMFGNAGKELDLTSAIYISLKLV